MCLSFKIEPVVLFSFLLDMLIGDPVYSLHPVRITGLLIKKLESIFFRIKFNTSLGGSIFFIIVLSCSLLFYISLRYSISKLLPSAKRIIDIFFLYSCIALRDLIDHTYKVLKALKAGNIESARANLRLMVSRNVENFDDTTVIRTVVESAGENFNDAFFAPIFWYTCGYILANLLNTDNVYTGTIFAISYRTINTLDSMVGYRNHRYRNFGMFSARIDDLVNFIPARLQIIVLLPSVLLLRLNWINTINVFIKDRLKDDSPNSGHGVSIFAGAMGIKVGGRIEYFWGIKNKGWIGNDLKDPSIVSISKSCCLAITGGIITIILSTLLINMIC